MIVFDNVTKYYKSNVGLEKVSVRINKGDFVFLVGRALELDFYQADPEGDRRHIGASGGGQRSDYYVESSGPNPAEKYRDRVPGFPSSAEEDRL